MKKNNFIKILVTCCLFFMMVLNVQAAITSDANIYQKINSLQTLSQYDFISLINKTEMIGNRLDAFNITTSQYKNTIIQTLERLNNIPSQVTAIKSSSDISDSDKQVQINNLYNNADTDLYNLDSQTMNYLYSLRNCMPTITYKKFLNKFLDLYNSQNLTNSVISI
ncbi:MAG: hypothetical protein LUH11_01830 [Candidatus Gastranaerophilales bacterium]|nr:hypothetical protein [Candidatus Gastranaerophilales bacterium]